MASPHGRIKRRVGSSSINTHIGKHAHIKNTLATSSTPAAIYSSLLTVRLCRTLSTHSSVLVWVSLVVARLSEDIATDNHGQTLHPGARLVAGAEVKECDVVEIS